MERELPEAAVERIVETALLRLRAAMTRLGPTTLEIVGDPTLGDPMARSDAVVQGLASGSVHRQPFHFIHANFTPERQPYLLHIRDERVAERVVNQSVRIAVSEALGIQGEAHPGRSVCAWIVSTEPASVWAARLAASARLIKPDGEPWPLRYWDPRVLWHLPRVLDGPQHERLRNTLGHWHWLGPTQAFDDLNAESTTLPTTSLARNPPLSVDETCWQLLSRIGTINQVLALTHDWGVPATVANAKRIDRLLQACRAHGFASDQDDLVFCTCALTSRDDFHRHPSVAEALLRSVAEGRSAMHALQAFDEGFWARLRSGTSERETAPATEEIHR